MSRPTVACDPGIVHTMDMGDYLGNLTSTTGLEESFLRLLRHGLRALAEAAFETVKDDHGDIAVPVTAEARDPSPFIAALENEDISVAFELALDTCPPSFWAVEALLGLAIKPALDRLPVGSAVLQLVQNAKAEAVLRDP